HEIINICEDKTGTITCDGLITVTSARYGRFDKVTCPHVAMTSTGCKADRVFASITSQCDGETTCTLTPTNTEYGDPCPGSYKYLEVNYTCQSPESTTMSSTSLTTTTTKSPTTTFPTTGPSSTSATTTDTTSTITTTTAPTVTTITTTAITTTSYNSTYTTTATLDTTTKQFTTSATTFYPLSTNTSTTAVPKIKDICTCICRLVNDTKCDNEDMLCKLAILKKELLITKSTLSSYKRKKISVYDGRTSATAIGMTDVSFTTPQQSTSYDQYSYTLLSNYGYTMGTNTWIVLKIRSCEDGYVGLMRKNHPKNHGDIYEVVIGGWGNTKTCIREVRQGQCNAEKTKVVLNCNVYQTFNISWTGGTVAVFTDDNGIWTKLLQWIDTSPFTVKFVGVTTSIWATGYWKIPQQGE
ncbi:mucin-2-like, partial [Ylistrum balloti]|uniref:mucin-2-like n=1 Tax=Ylistrum balloti TaxID=509963 RepID=UPI0029058C25